MTRRIISSFLIVALLSLVPLAHPAAAAAPSLPTDCEVLEKLYGSCQNRWVAEEGEFQGFAYVDRDWGTGDLAEFRVSNIRQRKISGERYAVATTSTGCDLGQGGFCAAHAQPGEVGVAVFKWVNGQWKAKVKKPYWVRSGGWGNAPAPRISRAKKSLMIVAESCDGGQGYFFCGATVAGFGTKGFKKLKSRLSTGYTDAGACFDTCQPTEWESSISFTGRENGWPKMKLTYSGDRQGTRTFKAVKDSYKRI